jgi:hypothetical protein
MTHLCITTFILCWTMLASAPDPVDQALTSIEVSGLDLEMFTADVAYRKDEALLERSEIRTGRVVYKREQAKQPTLGIRFDTRVLGNRLEQERKRIVFKDGWLIEVDESRQLTIKRQLAREGESMDPMRLGGPFPLPVGQPKASVLEQFVVTELAPPTHGMFKRIASTPGLVGLRLVPRANTPEHDDWSSIDLWYDVSTWLPIGVEATETNGDVRRIRLTNVARNTPLARPDEDVLVADSPMDDWTVDVRPLPPLPSPPPSETP